MHGATGDVVGDDRDAEAVIDALLRGVSVVLVGPLGSGKSHFLRHVVDLLARRGETALVLRSGGPLSAVPHGALTASTDPRATRLRDGRTVEGERPIVVIDDAQELDPDSVAAVVRAVYGANATALFAMTVTRDGSTRPTGGDSDAAHMAIDLWLRGLADRVDLAALTPRDADKLLDMFASTELDALARASIVALADGSRMLLRELAVEATHALKQGRDPLDALRDSAPYGRLSDALRAHIGQLSTAERSTLAVLGRVPRVARADAVRFLPSAVVDSLIASRLVHDDATPARRLTANSVLAKAADRRLAGTAVDNVLDNAVTRMLSSSSAWWCAPLAILLAESWLHATPIGPAYDDVDPAARIRAALDAARQANDDGEVGLAMAYVQLGLQTGDSAELRLEHAYSEAIQGSPIDVDEIVKSLSHGPVDSDTLLRCVSVAAIVDAADVSRISLATTRVGSLTCPDPRAGTELAILRAQFRLVSMDWAGAAEIAEAIYAQTGVPAALRMRAAMIAGLGRTCLGSLATGQEWFLRAHRSAGERGGISPVTTSDRLWAISVETIAAALTRTDLHPALSRLGGEIDAAARQGDAETQALAGLVLSTVLAALGRAPQAARELNAAVRRARPPAAAGWIPLAQIAVTRALALSDHAAEAEVLLDLIDPARVSGMPIMAHSRMVAESYVAAALGRREDALRATRAAAAASASAPTLHARDLYRAVALGETADALPKIQQMAEHSDVPSTKTLSELATALVESQEADGAHAVDALRRSTAWDTPADGIPGRLTSGGADDGAAVVDLELTRREREIALLVAEGLGNREIAERLYLSVRTVESHVYQARAKLGVRSRAELGRTVAPQRRTTGSDRPHLV